MSLLELGPDELLSTTRAVRKRLDFTKPVSDDLVRECVALALQAPSGGNVIAMRFVVVRDRAMVAAIADVYAQCWDMYQASPGFAGKVKRETDELQAQQSRVADSATYLSQHMAESPALVLGCTRSRLEDVPAAQAASSLANILPAMWSFMLAARARGLGTTWTTIHLAMEEAVADIVNIPFDTMQQVCLSPLAFTKGTDFKPAVRPDPDTVIDWR
ncbi:MAG: nitroreductase family protein [Ilumatobacteraceae bacterium]|nr:nitroreductase family protein [Ilumatobacteraceae bacterium]